MTIELRSATDHDKPRCMELLTELTSATAHGDRHERLQNCFDLLVSQLRGEIVVAEEGNVILGMATVSYNVALRYAGEYCQLEELIVTPQARGRKLGGLLVNKVLDNAVARGCAEIGLYLLEATEHNRAFYEKYGFRVIGSEMRQSLVAGA